MSHIPSQDRTSPTNLANNQDTSKAWQSNQHYSSVSTFQPHNDNSGANYSSQIFIRPPTGSKAIPIINPNNREVIQPPTKEPDQETSSPVKMVDSKEAEKEGEKENNVKEEKSKVKKDIENQTEAKEIEEKKVKDVEEKGLEGSEEVEKDVQAEKSGEDMKEEGKDNAIREESNIKATDETQPSVPAKERSSPETTTRIENKGDRVVYEIAFMMQFKDTCKALPAGTNLVPFEDMNAEKPTGRSMSRRQTSERGRGRGLAGEAMLRSGSGRRRQDSSQGMERSGSSRNRSSRGGKLRRAPKDQEGGSTPSTPLEEVAPLIKNENRWVPKVQTTEAGPKEEEELVSQEMIVRKVKSLLNKLTLEKFESISSQIWDYVKQAEKEEDAVSLKTVIDLIFDKACDEPAFAVMWAQLAMKLYELTTANENIKNVNILDEKTKKPVCGGPLYRKYLLIRCQSDFYKGWKSDIPKLDENDPNVMLTDEYYAAVKAKRRGLGLVQFIGELYKLRMLSNNVMKECLRRLCSNVETPEDEETETMCKLVTTVGKTFESSDINNRQWLDVCFTRMKEMYESKTLSSRVKFMILDVMDLRKSRWTLTRGGAQAGPKTIAQIHQEAKKANEEKEKETMKRSGSSRSFGSPISRQGSSRSTSNLSR